MHRRAKAFPFNRKILPTWVGIAIAKPYQQAQIPFPKGFQTRYNCAAKSIIRRGDWKGSPKPIA